MSSLISYQFNSENSIRVIDGKWFVAADICHGLRITDAAKAVRSINTQLNNCGIEGTISNRTPVETISGMQEMICVNESGLNLLIMQSRKKEAMPFKWWIASEVLPSIRKTGSYSLLPSIDPSVPMADFFSNRFLLTFDENRTPHLKALEKDACVTSMENWPEVIKDSDFCSHDLTLKIMHACTSRLKDIVHIPFGLKKNADYFIRVRNGKAIRKSVHFCELLEDRNAVWR